MTMASALHFALEKVPHQNVAYLVHPTHIVITTQSRATPEKQKIHGMFVKRPLEEILQDLAAQTGISIILDQRVGDKAKMILTAQFRNHTSLLTAVGLLADMADLKAYVVENLLYITSKKHTLELHGGPPAPPQR
jgi:hypothetical protein